MPSRRQEKVARVIKETVSQIIANRLSDPRIVGIVSVTQVDTSPDLKNADIYLSIMAPDETVARRTFAAIEHASRHIQSLLGNKMTSKFCPHLHFHEDKKMKKTLETLRLINEATKEFKQIDIQDDEDKLQ